MVINTDETEDFLKAAREAALDYMGVCYPTDTRLCGQVRDPQRERDFINGASWLFGAINAFIERNAFLNDERYKGACDVLEYLKEGVNEW